MKMCPLCCTAKPTTDFYQTSSYCKPCHKQRSREYRKQPHLRAKVRAAKNAWLKRHPEVNRRNVAAFRARQKALPSPLLPSDQVLVREAVVRLQLTKQRIQQLIDRGQLAAIRKRGRWLIDRVELERIITQRRLEAEDTQEAGSQQEYVDF